MAAAGDVGDGVVAAGDVGDGVGVVVTEDGVGVGVPGISVAAGDGVEVDVAGEAGDV